MLGALTEYFNESEVLLHALVWTGIDANNWTIGTAVTRSLGASQLVTLGKGVLEFGVFGELSDRARSILERADGLIWDRNGYVHAFWTPGREADRSGALMRERVRDAVRSPGARAVAFDVRDLRRAVFALHEFRKDIAELVAALNPGLADL